MPNLRITLSHIWSGTDTPGIATRILLIPLLALAAIPYRAAIALRNRLYDTGILKQTRLPCPVISIGNITVGGTGKTPLAITLANLLAERGYRPAILSRGYGGAGRPICIVSDGRQIRASAEEAGDEPLLIAQAARGVPVITGADRIQTGTFAIREFKPDLLILDDAFQHRRLFRDLDIVLLRSRNPFGNGYVLPRGPLREPLSGLQRAHMLVITTPDGTAEPTDLLPPLPRFTVRYLPTALLSGGEAVPLTPGSLRGKRICAFAGIGNPVSFRETLEALGGNIVSFSIFPDHHPYSNDDLTAIKAASDSSRADMIMTTEKDGMRLASFPSFLQQLFLLHVEIDIHPSRNEFIEFILQKLSL